MATQIDSATNDLALVADDAKTTFGSLSAEQLNWKPSENKWSVAQCFDHLIVTHSLYFGECEKVSTSGYRPTFWQKVSPLSGFFGRFLIKRLDPKNTKKMKTMGKAVPSASVIGGDIIERFVEHQRQMIVTVQKFPVELDLEKTIVTSPLLGFVTYSLADTLTFLPMHCRRHFDQAQRVVDSEGFPK